MTFDAAVSPLSSHRPVPADANGSRAVRRPSSAFTVLAHSIQEMGLMRRRYGYYWTKLIGAVVVLAGWVAAFIAVGDSWWQLANAAALAVVMTQIAFLGHDAAHRQIFKTGRWNDWVSLIVATCWSASATAGGSANTPGTMPTRTRTAPTPTSLCPRSP